MAFGRAVPARRAPNLRLPPGRSYRPCHIAKRLPCPVPHLPPRSPENPHQPIELTRVTSQQNKVSPPPSITYRDSQCRPVRRLRHNSVTADLLRHKIMLISDKQHQANRDNAEKSTGPRTPTGKHSSSSNALTHGALTAAAEAVAELGESAEDLAELQASFLDQYQPAPPTPTSSSTNSPLAFGNSAASGAWKRPTTGPPLRPASTWFSASPALASPLQPSRSSARVRDMSQRRYPTSTPPAGVPALRSLCGSLPSMPFCRRDPLGSLSGPVNRAVAAFGRSPFERLKRETTFPFIGRN